MKNSLAVKCTLEDYTKIAAEHFPLNPLHIHFIGGIFPGKKYIVVSIHDKAPKLEWVDSISKDSIEIPDPVKGLILFKNVLTSSPYTTAFKIHVNKNTLADFLHSQDIERVQRTISCKVTTEYFQKELLKWTEGLVNGVSVDYIESTKYVEEVMLVYSYVHNELSVVDCGPYIYIDTSELEQIESPDEFINLVEEFVNKKENEPNVDLSYKFIVDIERECANLTPEEISSVKLGINLLYSNLESEFSKNDMTDALGILSKFNLDEN